MAGEKERHVSIQVLRAIAVWAVIGYHFQIPGFKGGYIGVDLFFVLSGFLIGKKWLVTSGSLHEYRKYIAARFYRIYPVALTAGIISAFIGYFVLLPFQYRDFGASLVGLLTLTLNKMVANNINYFSPLAQTQPLLHFWSLMVEFQFYIALPILLLVFNRITLRHTTTIILIISIISIIYSHSLSQIDPKNSYYLLPARLFEFLIGVVIAIHRQTHSVCSICKPINKWKGPAKVGPTLGLLACIPIYGEVTLHPGLLTLPALLLVSLYLIFYDPHNNAQNPLARALVRQGNISYSLYVWHYIVLVFFLQFNSLATEDLSISDKAFLVLTSLVLSHFSYEKIEKRVAERKTVLTMTPRVYCLVLSLFCVVLGTIIFLKNGFNDHWRSRAPISNVDALKIHESSNRFESELTSECQFWTSAFNQETVNKANQCFKSRKFSILIVGDSHAIDVYRAIQAHLFSIQKTDTFVMGLASGGCKPYQQGENCYIKDLYRISGQLAGHFSKVVYVQRYTGLTGNDYRNPAGVSTGAGKNGEILLAHLTFLKGLGSEVVWMAPRVERGLDKAVFVRLGCRTTSEHSNYFAPEPELHRQLTKGLIESAEARSIRVIPAKSYDIAHQSCDTPFWRDQHHWSRTGYLFQADRLWGLIN